MKFLLLILLSTVSFVSADTSAVNSITTLTQQARNLGEFIKLFNGSVISSLGILLLSLAVICFFYGIVRFIWSMRQGEGKAAEAGKKFMLWGIFAIFVIFSIYGIVIFIQSTLGIKGGGSIERPCVDFVTHCVKKGNNLGSDQRVQVNNGSSTADPCAGDALGKVCLPSGYTTGSGASYSCQPSPCATIGTMGSDGKCYGDSCPNGCAISSDKPETCYGKSEWSSCTASGETGICLTSGGLQLVCKVGLKVLKSGDFCQQTAKTSICGQGLSCQFKEKFDGNDYYTCR
jgi:hypothetical protein